MGRKSRIKAIEEQSYQDKRREGPLFVRWIPGVQRSLVFVEEEEEEDKTKWQIWVLWLGNK